MRASRFGILVAVESLLLAGLLLLAAWLLSASVSSAGQPESLWPEAWAERMPACGSSEVMLAVVICAGLYGLLQFLGRSRLAFWLAALLALLPHAPGIWGHNQLEWQRFFGIDASFGAGHSLILTAGLFLMCLAGLIVLHRTIALQKLGLLLSSRRVEGAEGNALRLLSIPAALSLTALPSVAPLRMTRLRCDYQNTLSY